MSRQIGQSGFAEGSEGLTGWMDLLLYVLLNNEQWVSSIVNRLAR